MLLHIGIDDVDSHFGGCTTHVMYGVLKALLRDGGARLADFPRLVRLNPYVPFKTRGNAALAVSLALDRNMDVGDVKERVVQMVADMSERRGKASPGIVFVEGEVPSELVGLYRKALAQLVPKSFAVRLIDRVAEWRGGRGVIGAAAAIGALMDSFTFELLVYRDPTAERPRLDPAGLARAIAAVGPLVYATATKRRLLAMPRGGDPVLLGIRGLSPPHIFAMMAVLHQHIADHVVGWALYKTNQGTDAHWTAGEVPERPLPYSPYIARGIIIGAKRLPGRHVMLVLDSGIKAVVYRHLGRIKAVLERCNGCEAVLIGGVKPHGEDLFLYVEKALVVHDIAAVDMGPPRCEACGGPLTSMGRRGGHKCRRCGARYAAVARLARYRGTGVPWGLHVPREEEWRHLSAPPSVADLLGVASLYSVDDWPYIIF